MRVATIASLVVAASVGFTPAAQACSATGGSGPISTISHTISHVVEKVVSAVSSKPATGQTSPATTGTSTAQATVPAPAGGSTFITNNTTSNTTSATSITSANSTQNQNTSGTQTASATQPAGTQTAAGGTGSGAAGGGGTGTAAATVAASPSFGGGGGGGGGGAGMGGGGFSGSSGISGVPINPTSDLGLPATTMASGSGDGGSTPSFVMTDSTPAAQTPGVAFAASPQESDAPEPAKVTIASTLPSGGQSEGGSALPIAAISSTGVASLSQPSVSTFAFEGPATNGPPLTPRSQAMLLSGLGSIAILGTVWAWKSLT